MRRLTMVTFAAILLAVGFQNCSGSKSADSGNAGAFSVGPDEALVGPTSGYKRISWSFTSGAMANAQSIAVPTTNLPLLDERSVMIDLEGGTLQVSLSNPVFVETCIIDTNRLQALRQFIANGKLCKPAPPKPGDPPLLCPMAMSMPVPLFREVLQLIDADGNMVALEPRNCGIGLFFCGGKDELFRTLVADLRDNHSALVCSQPPAP